MEMAVNVTLKPGHSYSRYELLAWLNEALQTGFTKVEHICTGAAYCQLMHRLFPTSLDLSRVRFQSNNLVDSIHNYSLLQAAFRNVGVVQHIPIEALMKGDSSVSLTFLQWFKLFFDENKCNKEYHSLEARGGQSIVPVSPDDICSQTSHQKVEIILKMEGKTGDEPCKEEPKEARDGCADKVIIISDDEDGEADAAMEQRTEKWKRTVKEDRAELQAMKGVERTGEPDQDGRSNRLCDREALSGFIRTYCSESQDSNLNLATSTNTHLSTITSPNYLKDIIQACSRAPYCLYLYMGVELGGGQTTGVVLVGFLDQSSGVSAVRLLNTMQMSAGAARLQMPVQHTADSDAHLLIEMLKRFDLPLSNLSVFYCNAPHPAGSQVFVSQLQAFNPNLVSLCGLPGMAGRACQSGILASFPCVVDLVRDIHRHYSSRLSVKERLKAIFADEQFYDPARPISDQCLDFIRTVQKIVGKWRDLVKYFKSLTNAEDANHILIQLTRYKVQLKFLFLSHTLEPLRALQELQQHDPEDVAGELQLASMLIHSYKASVLRPAAVERFHSRRDLHFLQSERDLLPVKEVNIGASARDFLSVSTYVDLGEQERGDFLKAVVTFYKESLQSIMESIPENLGDVTLKNMGTMLKHLENRNNGNLSRLVLLEVGVQLGLCHADSPEAFQLLRDYSSCLSAAKKAPACRKSFSWTKMLDTLKSDSILRRLLLILSAVPSCLRRKQIFAKVFKNIKDLHESKDVAPRPNRRPGRSWVQRKQQPSWRRHGRKQENDSSSEDSDSFVAKPSLHTPFKHTIASEDSDCTDNSSDVVDVTEESKASRIIRPTNSYSQASPPAETVVSVEVDDDEDYDNYDNDVVSRSSSSDSAGLQDVNGELVWCKVEGFSPWPAMIVSCRGKKLPPEKRTVLWYGQTVSSQVSVQSLKPFAFFGQFFCSSSLATHVTYREALFLSLQEAARRCSKQFSACLNDDEEQLKQMLDWALGGFQPTGPEGFKPTSFISGCSETNVRPKAKTKLNSQRSTFVSHSAVPVRTNISKDINEVAVTLNNTSFKVKGVGSMLGEELDIVRKDTQEEGWRGVWHTETRKGGRGGYERERDEGRGGWGKGKVKGVWKTERGQKKKFSSSEAYGDDDSPDFVPYKRRSFIKTCKSSQEPSVYKQPDQKLREDTIHKIMDMNLDIEGFCLCCATEDVEMFHPLFKGSLCLKCKDNFTETLYRYDEDGYQSYCTICCYGLEVILCGNDSCCRSYCEDCLNILVRPGTFDCLKLLDPWICYLCQPHQPHGALIPREDWSIRVQELFANTSAMEFEPHRVYPSVPASCRRPLRVLSLFDGIGTGYLVLKDLGLKVERYVASEVCEDSIAVSSINHDGRIIHVGDSRFITKEQLDQWGPFDLLIGGSPCNDLSIVNPLRKGLYEGTGRLFFEFYRILQLLKPTDDDPRPFFWLFENVVFMNTHDKVNICRFLECNPVLVDAVKVSPAHRARYFWGNIPGMSRPIIASNNDKLMLQDCLEIGREARVTKVRTITTHSNSLKQGKDVSLLPVVENGREDNLWITELEKIFGFPKHYTDVRNMNRQQRQKVLGKAWSVPVIRHLFAPLKDYFACEELPPLSTSTPSTCLSSPASPQLVDG